VTTLANAPLVEVVTEFRWGRQNASNESEVSFEFADEELQQLQDRFSSIALERGFGVVQVARSEEALFAPTRMHRQTHESWPVYQIGLGVLTINQANEDYDWPTYKDDVLTAIRMLRHALEGIYSEIPFIGAELVYVDAFFFEEDETPEEFLLNKLAIRVRVPDGFLAAPQLEQEPWSADFRVRCKLSDPQGDLTISVESPDRILGRRGILMTTRVLSVGVDLNSDAKIEEWLDSAHSVQRHAFKTLIQPAYQRSFA
jgi:uncharacterized protein (TIGR04255 family)